ncbi:MAG: succinylglutamate desuccinylase/aspartoacylase family protein [Planctomycetales bacterium]|nr:succinylglutamate desuccinylase/aspartoacylase family protein [Planctomycetales bacterium]
MAGNHGDEYPGQIAIMRLLRKLTPQDVTGRIILIPALNMPAARASTRLSSVDGMNLNRCFLGDPNGTVTQMIAYYLTTVLFPLSDVVVDLHVADRFRQMISARWPFTSTVTAGCRTAKHTSSRFSFK